MTTTAPKPRCAHCGNTEALSNCVGCNAPMCAGHRDRHDKTKCYQCRGFDALNATVTSAILRAERLPLGTPQARDAWYDVAFAEEALSALTSPITVEGAICRRGAITAALKTGNARYAEGLARGYLNETLPDDLRADLDELHAQTLKAIEELGHGTT